MRNMYGGLILLLASLSLGAQGQRGGLGMEPPQEVFDVCKNIPADTSCSFKAPHGTVSGNCRNINQWGHI